MKQNIVKKGIFKQALVMSIHLPPQSCGECGACNPFNRVKYDDSMPPFLLRWNLFQAYN